MQTFFPPAHLATLAHLVHFLDDLAHLALLANVGAIWLMPPPNNPPSCWMVPLTAVKPNTQLFSWPSGHLHLVQRAFHPSGEEPHFRCRHGHDSLPHLKCGRPQQRNHEHSLFMMLSQRPLPFATHPSCHINEIILALQPHHLSIHVYPNKRAGWFMNPNQSVLYEMNRKIGPQDLYSSALSATLSNVRKSWTLQLKTCLRFPTTKGKMNHRASISHSLHP